MKLTEFEKVELRRAILNDWKINASAQGHPSCAWATLAVDTVARQLEEWMDGGDFNEMEYYRDLDCEER